MKLKILLLLIPLVLSAIITDVSGAEGKLTYEIKIKVKGLTDTTFYLSNFYAKNQYYRDTARSDKKGQLVFSGEDELEQGMYSLVLGNRKIFDFFVIEKFVSFETDTVNTVGNMIIKGSPENELFYKYVRFLQSKEEEIKPLQKKASSENVDERKAAQEALAKVDKEVFDFQKRFYEENKKYFVPRFLNSMREIEVPDPPKDAEGNITDSLFQYRYFREHYFDQIDFSDERFLRTPSYHQKLSAYIQKYTYQIPDSLYKAIDFVVNKSRANEELFRYTVSWITNTYEKSKIMGMDAIFVHMAENYYLTDEVDWVDSAQKRKINEQYLKLKPLLIGKVAPNIVLTDTSQKEWYNLHKIDATYTLVYIWSPTCGHCKKVTPKMHKVYEKYKDYGFKVFAVGTEFDNVEWKKYIKTHNLTWINVSDSPEHPNNIKDYPLNFRVNYDVFSTPKIYLLDKDKRIVAKRIEDEQIDDFLSRAFGLSSGGTDEQMQIGEDLE
ncbi:MAG: DUF5106 domain-containing protein [Vicingaceae bacterium]